MNRPLRITLLTVLAVALVTAGAVGGALYTQEDPKKQKKFSEMSKGSTVCSASEPVLDRIVPDAPYADSRNWETRTEELKYNAKCRIAAGGKEVMRVTVEQENSVHKPRRGTGSGQGKTKSIPGYKHGWSSPDAAGLSVPCTKNTGDDNATNLYVKAQAWRKNYPELRADMVRIAKQAAKNYRTTACAVLPALDGPS